MGLFSGKEKKPECERGFDKAYNEVRWQMRQRAV